MSNGSDKSGGLFPPPPTAKTDPLGTVGERREALVLEIKNLKASMSPEKFNSIRRKYETLPRMSMQELRQLRNELSG